MNAKTYYREQFLRLRSEMSDKEVYHSSQRIRKRLLNLEAVTEAESFFVYISQGNEVDTYGIITSLLNEGKTVTAPKVRPNKTIEPHILTGFHELIPGNYGILEPHTEIYDKPIDITIVPAVVVDYERHRLGMGGGYYDRFLKKNLGTTAIALAYNYQLLDEVPTEKHDQPVDLIVTERMTL